MIRLNAQGWTARAIAEIFECQGHTVRATLHRWQRFGLGGLWDATGRGAKQKWLEAALVYLETCLEQEPRTFNSSQLAHILAQERLVQLSPDRIRRVLKKRDTSGNERGAVNKSNLTLSTNNSNKLT